MERKLYMPGRLMNGGEGSVVAMVLRGGGFVSFLFLFWCLEELVRVLLDML